MKPSILLLAFLAVLAISSCTTAYKTAQTPDDVYYSPARPQEEYVSTENQSRRYYSNDEYYDDRYLRMKVRNRARWEDLDEWYYYGNRYNTVYFHNAWNNPWTPYTYWNCTYNPYYHVGVIITPTSPTYNRPRVFNLNAYNAASVTSSNYNSGKSTNTGVRNTYTQPRYNNNTNSNAGNILRNVFNSNNNNSNSSNNSSTPKTTTSSSSSSSSGSSGSSAPVRRF